MPRNYETPEVVIAPTVIPIYKRELRVRWIDTDEKNQGVSFTIEREGKMITFKADAAKLDEPLAQFNNQTLRQVFDALGDTCLNLDHTDYEELI